MKILYNWLKDYIDLKIGPGELVELLDSLGIPVEEFKYLGEGLDKLVVGEIVSIKDHPKSQNLKVLEIFVGDDTIQVVSGAPGLYKGMRVVQAMPGTVLPNGMEIGEREIKGVKSYGMPLSEEELGLSDHSGTIIELPENMKAGESPLSFLQMDDYLYDLEITHNRGDLLGYIGIAQDIKAKTGFELIPPKVGIEDIPEIGTFPVEIVAKDGCPRYTARIIKGVKVGPSPHWMRYRLALIGQRPINNIVDITNYVLFELGEPIHAFDLAKLDEKIVVRYAKPGEKFVTLDGVERELTEDVLVIADEEKPVAIAGIMGGEESGVKEDTEDLLIEAAYFSPITIRKGSMVLKLSTEASYRFERKVDPELPPLASNRIARLITDIAGGKVGPLNDVNYLKIKPAKIFLKKDYLDRLLGYHIPSKRVVEIFENLGFTVHENPEGFETIVPTRRQDISLPADLVEEVARIFGYDNIPGKIISTSGELVGRKLRKKSDYFRDFLIRLGLYEVKTIEFVGKKELNAFRFDEKDAVKIKNPVNESYEFMRPILSMSVVQVVSTNWRRGLTPIRVFEAGKAFLWQGADILPIEDERICVMMTGKYPKTPFNAESTVDYYDLKATLDALSEEFGFDFELIPFDFNFLNIGARIIINGKDSGFIGELSTNISKLYDIKDYVYVLELTLSNIEIKDKKFKPFPIFPAVKRDISILTDVETPYVELEKLLSSFESPLLRNFRLVDIYSGKPLPEGKKSLTFTLEFQSEERTLSDEEVDKEFEKLVTLLKNSGFYVRGIDDVS